MLSNGDSIWKRRYIPGDSVPSDRFAVSDGEVVRIQVHAQDGHSAPYIIETTFMALGTPCLPDSAEFQLESGVVARGCVGFDAGDEDDEWFYTAAADGYLLFQFTNEHPRGTEQGRIENAEVISNGDSIWKRRFLPSESFPSDRFAVSKGQIVRVQVSAQARHAAPYTIKPAFTPLGRPCQPDDDPAELHSGVTSSGCVGFDRGDDGDAWSYAASAEGYVLFEFANEHPRGTEQGRIEFVEVSSNGDSIWKRRLLPGESFASDRIAVRAGQVVRIVVKAQPGHAAPYSVRPIFQP